MPLLSKAGRALAAAACTAALTLTAAPPAFAQDAEIYSTFEFVEVPGVDYLVDPADAMVEMEQAGRLDVHNADRLADGDVLEVRFTVITWGVTFDPVPGSEQDCREDPDERSVTCTLSVGEDTDFETELPFELALRIEESYLMDGAYVEYRIETAVNGETVASEDLEFVVGDLALDLEEPSAIDSLHDIYEYEILYHHYTLTDAVPGTTLTGNPYFFVDGQSEGTSPFEYAATVVWFEHSTDAWARRSTGEVIVGAVEVVADYDNCIHDELQVVCVLPGFTPTVGFNYAPSEDTPVLYEVHEEVTEWDPDISDERVDQARYGAYTIDQEQLDHLLEDGVDLDGDDQFSLVETDGEPSLGHFVSVFAVVDFDAPEGAGGDELPQTGSSSTAVLASAFGAVAVGAAALVVSRRRRSAENRG